MIIFRVLDESGELISEGQTDGVSQGFLVTHLIEQGFTEGSNGPNSFFLDGENLVVVSVEQPVEDMTTEV